MDEHEARLDKKNNRSACGNPSGRVQQSRATQTRMLAGAIVLAVAGFVGWQEINRDYSSMPPTSRCEYTYYRQKHGWDSELQCKANAAAAGLSGRSFNDDNPYR